MKCAHCLPRQNLLWYECADVSVMHNQSCDRCSDGRKVELQDGTSVLSGIAYFHDEFMAVWLHTVPKHIPAYIGYRLEMFSYFMFDTWSPTLEAVSEDYHPKYSSLFKATAAYTNSMSNRWLPLLFCPGIYLFINIGTVVVATKNRERLAKDHFLFCFWLSFASIFWLLSQIPIVPVPDYRYAYFSIVVTMLALIFLVSGFRRDQTIGSSGTTVRKKLLN